MVTQGRKLASLGVAAAAGTLGENREREPFGAIVLSFSLLWVARKLILARLSSCRELVV